jgi:hypothetical protein
VIKKALCPKAFKIRNTSKSMLLPIEFIRFSSFGGVNLGFAIQFTNIRTLAHQNSTIKDPAGALMVSG